MKVTVFGAGYAGIGRAGTLRRWQAEALAA